LPFTDLLELRLIRGLGRTATNTKDDKPGKKSNHGPFHLPHIRQNIVILVTSAVLGMTGACQDITLAPV
jgi:hypothetical protein